MDYRPSSVILGEDDPKRDFFAPGIRDTEKASYDYRTVFFDAVHLKGDHVIRLFAPPMLNFLKNPGRPDFFLGPEKCRFSRHQSALKRFEEWRVHIPKIRHDVDKLNVRFPSGLSFDLDVNIPEVLPANSRVLTAIQKDNRLRWIKDWYRYYREEFGVDHLVLYDNGSANQNELDDLLGEHPVTVVRWNFPYGPSISHDNKFTQIGALNHCRRVFGRDSWIFSFDIDELLVDPKGNVRKTLNQRSVHYFSSYFVPFKEGLPEDYSFSDFNLRRINATLTGKKYIYRAPDSSGVLPHYVNGHNSRLIGNATILLKKAINRIRWTSGQKDNWKTGLLNIILQLLLCGKKQEVYEIDDAYFLHFKSISTNWKGRGKRFTAEPAHTLIPIEYKQKS